MINKRLKKICNDLGWFVMEYNECISLQKYSPAGEDFFFAVNKDNYLNEVIEYAENFDVDEHAKMWIENIDTVSGVPQSIRILVNDAYEIKGMLLELAENLRRYYETK